MSCKFYTSIKSEDCNVTVHCLASVFLVPDNCLHLQQANSKKQLANSK